MITGAMTMDVRLGVGTLDAQYSPGASDYHADVDFAAEILAGPIICCGCRSA